MSLSPSKLRAFYDNRAHGSWAPIQAEDCAMLADAVEIADSCARADIESRLLCADDNPQWWDTSTASEEDREMIGQAVRYLTARGLIERHPERVELVRFNKEREG